MLIVLLCCTLPGCGTRKFRTASRPKAIHVVPSRKLNIKRIANGNRVVRNLLAKADRSIGTQYKWGGADLRRGIDCSNFTWQLYRTVGLPYNRYYSTSRLSRIRKAGGLRSIRYKDATTGDLLVYGKRSKRGKWHGHVVILIDKDGSLTGKRGLALGAHGGNIDSVQYITYKGHNRGYYVDPQMKLCNVIRVAGIDAD
jgi:NlpC/P60 family